MRRMVCDLCKNIISEVKPGERGTEGSRFSGDITYSLTVMVPGFLPCEFDLCTECSRRLAYSLERGILERSDLSEIPEEAEAAT